MDVSPLWLLLVIPAVVLICLPQMIWPPSDNRMDDLYR